MRKLEIIVLNAADSIAAEMAGADRLELVSNMEVGGLSPTISTIKEVIAAVTIPVNVMVRFKAENFVYDQYEFSLIISYIEAIKDLGINGIVFGSLNPDGTINKSQLHQVKAACKNLDITFHRAIDEEFAVYNTNIEAIENEVTNILTSGGLEFAIENNIDILDFHSEKRVQILAGGGISSNNYAQLFKRLSNVDFHIGSLAYNKCDFTQGINDVKIRQLKQELNLK